MFMNVSEDGSTFGYYNYVANDCKRKWKYLRDQYVKNLKTDNDWLFRDDLQFLSPYLYGRRGPLAKRLVLNNLFRI